MDQAPEIGTGQARRRRGVTLVELLVVLAIIGILMALLLPAVQAAREAARRTSCRNHLRQIGIAIHHYHLSHRRLPSGWLSEKSWSDPGWGWSTLLLPYLEQQSLHDRLELFRPIDDPANAFAVDRILNVYQCPSDPTPTRFTLRRFASYRHPPEWPPMELGRSNYAAVYGTGSVDLRPSRGDGLFFHNSRVRLADVDDGTSQTFAVGERASRVGGTTWLGKIFAAQNAMVRIVGTANHPPNDPAAGLDVFGSYHPGGALMLYADGSVDLLSDDTSADLFRALATRQANEVVDRR